MASGLKWIMAVAGASALLVVPILNWELDPPSWRQRSPAEVRRNALGEEASQALERLLRLEAEAEVRRHLPAEPGFRVVLDDTVSGRRADSTRTAAGASRLPEPSRARLLLLARKHERRAVFASASGFYAGQDERGPYCVRVYDELERVEDEEMGPCVFWARYGAPGRAIGAWLQRGGFMYALAPARVMAEPDTLRRRTLWGKHNSRQWRGLDEVRRSCLAGVEESCVRMMLDTVPNSGQWMRPGSLWHYGEMSMREAALLAHLEQLYGPDSFERFWRSEQPLETAFASAFGAPLATWIRDWAQRYHGVEQRGPGLDLWTALLALLTFLLLAGAGVVVLLKRQVH